MQHAGSLLRHVGSFVAVLSCSVACGIFVPPPGIEPMSPALKGRFLTTGPPGKSLLVDFFFFFFDDGHSDWCEAKSHCSFDLHFSNNQWGFYGGSAVKNPPAR